MYSILFKEPGRIDFLLNGRKYEKVVAKIKMKNFSPGDSGYFFISSDYDTSTLKPIDTNKNENNIQFSPRISVQLNPEGLYTIYFNTVDRHHAGFGGYLYHEKLIKEGFSVTEPANEPGHSYKFINKNWFSFYNNN